MAAHNITIAIRIDILQTIPVLEGMSGNTHAIVAYAYNVLRSVGMPFPKVKNIIKPVAGLNRLELFWPASTTSPTFPASISRKVETLDPKCLSEYSITSLCLYRFKGEKTRIEGNKLPDFVVRPLSFQPTQPAPSQPPPSTPAPPPSAPGPGSLPQKPMATSPSITSSSALTASRVSALPISSYPLMLPSQAASSSTGQPSVPTQKPYSYFPNRNSASQLTPTPLPLQKPSTSVFGKPAPRPSTSVRPQEPPSVASVQAASRPLQPARPPIEPKSLADLRLSRPVTFAEKYSRTAPASRPSPSMAPAPIAVPGPLLVQPSADPGSERPQAKPAFTYPALAVSGSPSNKPISANVGSGSAQAKLASTPKSSGAPFSFLDNSTFANLSSKTSQDKPASNDSTLANLLSSKLISTSTASPALSAPSSGNPTLAVAGPRGAQKSAVSSSHAPIRSVSDETVATMSKVKFLQTQLDFAKEMLIRYEREREDQAPKSEVEDLARKLVAAEEKIKQYEQEKEEQASTNASSLAILRDKIAQSGHRERIILRKVMEVSGEQPLDQMLDSADIYEEITFLKQRMERTEARLDAEVEARRRAESRLRDEQDRHARTVKEIERECKEPFVVPSLLDAFLDMSAMTDRVLLP
ncbi:hypothetical protein FA95DRAFT_1677592 [Auriscalpium vulgare]|uniref:Uncharacterized protein n=1 Tax=Auriscalpium vulgare TaxID=40419 RepID=A0ACB8RYR0_9AGAM|nr:hypothetical protein FA95DRAFT_1677592 [Auriscalpium vulgare]